MWTWAQALAQASVGYTLGGTKVVSKFSGEMGGGAFSGLGATCLKHTGLLAPGVSLHSPSLVWALCLALTQGEDLPEQHSKGPDIALCGVHLVKDALRGHPLQGQAGLEDVGVSCGEREGKGWRG